MAFQKNREWLKDSRKFKILQKAYDIVRGTEFEEIVNRKAPELWIQAWVMDEDRRQKSLERAIAVVAREERAACPEEGRIVREIRLLEVELLRDDVEANSERFVSLWSSINERYEQIYVLEQARERVKE
jgi:hypothetical protein